MTWAFIGVAGVGAAASLAGGAMSSNASKKASQAQADAANNSTAQQTALSREALDLQRPSIAAGDTARAEAMRLIGLGGDPNSQGYGQYASADPGANWMKFQDPGYNFRLSEGVKAFDHSAAARGGTLSGNILKGRENYVQDLASEEYNNAFNRYQTIRSNTLNPYLSLAGAGQTSAQAGGNILTNLGSQVGENITGAGNARASGYIGSGNAWNGALGGVANSAFGAANGYMNYNMFSKMSNGGYGQPTMGGGYYPSSSSGNSSPYNVGGSAFGYAPVTPETV